MLTIGQLATYIGVTPRAVRLYHQKGLLPEPERDVSGYRRYGAEAVVELIRIRALADAGVPLARVRELLGADEATFAAAVDDIDRRLRREIAQKQEHRRRIARLAAGDSLALPAEAVAYLDRLRKLGLHDRMVDAERDAWILVAAQLPEHMTMLMDLKQAQLDQPGVVEMYRDLWDIVDWTPDDPRLPAVADKLVAIFEASPDADGSEDDFPLVPELVALLDRVFIDSVPCAQELMRLIEERGWTGWTHLKRVGVSATAGLGAQAINDDRAPDGPQPASPQSREH